MATVVTVRSYSRNSGDTSCEHVTSSPRAASSLATTLLVCRRRGRRAEGTPRPRPRRPGRPGCSPGRAARSRDRAPSSRPPTSTRSVAGTSGAGPVGHRVVQRRPDLARDLDDVGEASRRHERDPSAAALEQGVGRDRGAVGEQLGGRVPRRRRRAQPRRACVGSSGVDGTLTTRPSSPTRSVNVPPVSTPSRMRSSVAASCRRRKLRRESRQRRRSRRPRRPGRTPPRDGVDHGALCRLAELPAVAVGDLEAVDRLALDRAHARRVHVDAGAGERRRDRVEQPGTVGRSGPRTACTTAMRRRRRRLRRPESAAPRAAGRTPRRSPPVSASASGGSRLRGQHAERVERAAVAPRGDDRILHARARRRRAHPTTVASNPGRSRDATSTRHSLPLPSNGEHRTRASSRGRQRLEQRSLTGDVGRRPGRGGTCAARARSVRRRPGHRPRGASPRRAAARRGCGRRAR